MHALLNVIQPISDLADVSAFSGSPFDNLRKVRLEADGKSVENKVVYLERQDAPAPIEEPVPDVEALIENARQEERAAAEVRLQDALEAQRREFAEIIKAQRARWVEEESAVLAKGLEKEFSLLEHELGDKIGGVLSSFVAAEFKAQALQETAELLTAIMSDADHPLVRVSGPADLLDSLKASVGSLMAAVEFTTADQPDISIVADDAQIETQISAWGERLAKLNPAA